MHAIEMKDVETCLKDRKRLKKDTSCALISESS